MPYRSIILAALQAAGLYIAGAVVPFLGQMAILFVPVPLVIVTVLQGRAAGLSSIALAAVLVALLGSWQTAMVLFVLGFGLMAIGLSEGILRDLRPEGTVLIGTLLPLAALLVLLAPILLQAGKDPMTLVETFLRTSIADVQKLYTDLGATEVAQTLDAASDTIVFYLVRLMPGILLATTVMQAAACYGLARTLVLRKHPTMPLASRPSLPLWHAPDLLVWPLIVILGLIALPDRGLRLIGLNFSFVFLFLYAAQGVAVLEFYYRKARIPLLLRGILHTVILALPSVVAVVAIGVVDIWADFRKVRVHMQPPAAGGRPPA